MRKVLFLLAVLLGSINLSFAADASLTQAMSSCPVGSYFVKELIKGRPLNDQFLFNPDTYYKPLSTTTYAVFTITLPVATNTAYYPKGMYWSMPSVIDGGWYDQYYPNTKNLWGRASDFEIIISETRACDFDGTGLSFRKYTMADGGAFSIPIYPSDNFQQLNYMKEHLNAGKKYYITVRGRSDEVGKYTLRKAYDAATKNAFNYNNMGGGYGIPLVEEFSSIMQRGATFADDTVDQSQPKTTNPNSPSNTSFVNIQYRMGLYSNDQNTNGGVTDLQKFLKLAACPDLLVTGFFGSKTEACVKEYQKQKSLPATGYIGEMTKAALNSDGTKAAIVGGNINATVCGNSDLPINTVAGPSTSVSQAGWGGTASYVGPNLVTPSRVYLGKTFSVTANYQNEGLTIETNPLSSDPSNGIVIKQTSATSFDVTVNDGKFITKNSPEAKLYVRAKSNYTPKKGEVYRDGCAFVTVSPDNSANNSNTNKTPTINLTSTNLPVNGAVTLSVSNLVPGASVPKLCVMGTNTSSYSDTCGKPKPAGRVFEVTPNSVNESVPYCQPYSSKVDGYGSATYLCTAATPGNLKTNVSSTYRNPYNIWVYDQDVDVSAYDNSKTHYNKSATVQLNITDTGSSNIVDSCPNGQSMYAGLDGLSAPSCTSCAYIPESIRSGISKCSSVVDAPATWQTSVVSGSVDKGVLSSGFERYNQCPNGAPGSVGQTCSNKGYSCYLPNSSNSSSYTVYKCPGYTGAANTLVGKAYSEDNTGKLTPVPAGYQIAAGLLVPYGFSCSKVITTNSDGSYDFNGNAGCAVGLPNIALYAPGEILNGTGPGQTVFSNSNSLASVRPTSYGTVPDLVYYNGVGNYTFANNSVVGNPDTSACEYDASQQQSVRIEKIFTQRPSKAPMGTAGVYNGKIYWYASELYGGFWKRSIGKCSDPVSGNGSGQTARSLVGYVHKLQCSDISSSVYSAFKQSNYKPYNFFIATPASESIGSMIAKRVMAYYSSDPVWEVLVDGVALPQTSFNISVAKDLVRDIDGYAIVTKADALKNCGL